MVLETLLGERATADEAIPRRGRVILLALGVLAVVAGPLVQTFQPYLLNVLVPILIYALLILSLDFVFGYCGLPSFAHAAMFGVGGYTAAMLLRGPTQNPIVVLVVAFVMAVIVAVIISALSVRSTGLYFAFLTLAFTVMFQHIVNKDVPAQLLGMSQFTHGSNGIVGIPMFSAPFLDFSDQLTYYYVTLFVLVLVALFIVRLANSPFGTTMRGIRENEDRMCALGYNTTRYKVMAFSVTGGIAGIGGALYVPFQSLVSPTMLGWQLSGDLILYSLIGGLGTLWGPVIATAGIQYLENSLNGIAWWQLVVGFIYVVVILLEPGGIAGLIDKTNGFRRRVREEDFLTALSQVGQTVRDRFNP